MGKNQKHIFEWVIVSLSAFCTLFAAGILFGITNHKFNVGHACVPLLGFYLSIPLEVFLFIFGLLLYFRFNKRLYKARNIKIFTNFGWWLATLLNTVSIYLLLPYIY